MVCIANGTHTKVAGTRIVCLFDRNMLYSVLYVPALDCSLISVRKLNKDLNCETKFFANYYVFQDLDSGATISSAKLSAGLPPRYAKVLH